MKYEEALGYFYGTLLGDGHINYTPRSLESASDPKNRRGPMLMLKVTDLDFIEKWRDAVLVLTGFNYKISKHNPGTGSGAHRQQYKLRVANRELVDRAEFETAHKTRIPDCILNGSRNTKIAFVQGLMDSEGWVNVILQSLGHCDFTLGFGCTDVWFDDFYALVQSLGVKTSKIYKRERVSKKNGELGRQLHLFKLDFRDYKNAGLDFSIKRKSDRLAFALRILNDYTQDYPRYEDYFAVEDIV